MIYFVAFLNPLTVEDGRRRVNSFQLHSACLQQQYRPHTGKIKKKHHRFFERGENLLQNDILNFPICQCSGIGLES